MKKFLLSLICCSILTPHFGQQTENISTYKEKYPNANSIRLLQNRTIRIKLINDELDISQITVEQDLYLSNNATYNSKQSINYSTFFQLTEISAKNQVWTNGKLKTYEVEEFKKKDNLENSFYDDNKTVNYIYPNLEKGSKTTLQYTYSIKNPRFLNAFYFGSYFPIINSKLTLIVDKGVNMHFKTFNTEEQNITFQKTEKRKYTEYTWTGSTIEDYTYEEQSPNFKNIFPHVIPIITSYHTEKGEIKLSGGPEQLYKWYYGLTKEVREEKPSQELIDQVNSITEGIYNDEEKVEAIFNWAQKNIKYVAFEYALGGFIPRKANDVFEKKYGDCKDNTSLMYKMLEIAGLNGHFTWIGTRELPYSYIDVPTPISDNHMILAYFGKNKTHFLDATGRYSNLDLPTSFIQGKEALISIDEINHSIEKVPVVSGKENSLIEKSKLSLNGKKLIGNSKIALTGYQKIECFYELETLKTEEKKKSFYNGLFEKGNNSFLIGKIEETNKFNYYGPFTISIDYTIDNAVNSYGDEVYINLNLNKELLDLKTKEKRKNDLEIDYLTHNKYETVFKIPEGYRIDYLPEQFAIKNDFFDCSISYESDGDQIKYVHEYEIKTLTFRNDFLKKLNSDLDKISKAFQEVIVLLKV